MNVDHGDGHFTIIVFALQIMVVFIKIDRENEYQQKCVVVAN